MNYLVQAAIERAGIDPLPYSAQSLRAGFVTHTHLRGAGDRAIRPPDVGIVRLRPWASASGLTRRGRTMPPFNLRCDRGHRNKRARSYRLAT